MHELPILTVKNHQGANNHAEAEGSAKRAGRAGQENRSNTANELPYQGNRIRLLWKKPAESGLPGSSRNVSPPIRNLYSYAPGSSSIVAV